jgi:hypothetical protein
MGKRVADVLVETLQVAGVKTCYGIVGPHEEAGAFAAAAEGLLTKIPKNLWFDAKTIDGLRASGAVPKPKAPVATAHKPSRTRRIGKYPREHLQ